jgi:hypothetical protein
MSTPITWAGDSALATKTLASSFHGMMSIFSPPSSATTAWTRRPRWPTVAPTGSRPSWRDDTATFEREPGSRAIALISTCRCGPRDLELEQALQEALVRPADEDLRTAARAADLEDVGLDVLADPVVLDLRLLRGREAPPRRCCRRRG